jgi:hypothetical protein
MHSSERWVFFYGRALARDFNWIARMASQFTN